MALNTSFAIPVAAVLAVIGVALLIINAVIHPESVPRPDVRIPDININLPAEAGGGQIHRSVHTSVVNANNDKTQKESAK